MYPESTIILQKIKKIREDKGYSQEYMAHQLHIQQSTYHKLETGKQKLKIDHFLKILEMLEVDILKIL